MAKIDLSNISHSYNPEDENPVYALNPFSMTWENGNRYAILGPSGCGKTTMLNIVSGLTQYLALWFFHIQKDLRLHIDFHFPTSLRKDSKHKQDFHPLDCMSEICYSNQF